MLAVSGADRQRIELLSGTGGPRSHVAQVNRRVQMRTLDGN